MVPVILFGIPVSQTTSAEVWLPPRWMPAMAQLSGASEGRCQARLRLSGLYPPELRAQAHQAKFSM